MADTMGTTERRTDPTGSGPSMTSMVSGIIADTQELMRQEFPVGMSPLRSSLGGCFLAASMRR